MEPIARPRFFDIEVRILNLKAGEYPVAVTLEDGTEALGALSPEVLTWEFSGKAEQIGQRLFDALLATGRVREVWGVARLWQRRVRLRIDPPELHALPWELLHDGRVMLSAHADTPFSRYLPVDLPLGQTMMVRPIRILAAISNPSDLATKYGLATADVEVEKHMLQEALGREGFVLDTLDTQVTLNRIEEKLRNGYQVLHLIAHGAFNAKRQQSAVYLQDEDATSRRVIDDEFTAMLARLHDKPALIVLAACQSATRSSRDEFTGLGPKLIRAGLPAVIAMQDFVTIATAQQFSATLYAQLLSHATIDLAVNQARGTLLTAGRPDAAVPVLFMRLKDGQLWKLPDQPPAANLGAASASSSSSIGPAVIDMTDPVALRKLLVTRYNLEEIRTLCADIGVDYDNLGGEGKEAKARELIAYLRRRNKLDDLIRYLQESREV